jgi:hypothetical protein
MSRFIGSKSDLPEIGVDLLLDLRVKGIMVQAIRCDNAPENKQFELECRREKLGVRFEYTSPGTPQLNVTEVCHAIWAYLRNEYSRRTDLEASPSFMGRSGELCDRFRLQEELRSIPV